MEIKDKNIVIIHFEEKTPRMLLKVLKSLDLNLTFNEFDNEHSVFVSPYRCLRGVERRRVILYLDQEEYFLKAFIPEAMTRATVELTILLSDGMIQRENDEKIMYLPV